MCPITATSADVEVGLFWSDRRVGIAMQRFGS